MIVNVSFFAAVKDMMGTESMELSLDDEATIGELKQTLVEQNPALMELAEKSIFSVDQEYVSDEKQLYHGANVGFIPPVSGG
ncbi:MAG: molybdopterin converting factor subunit 1 [Mariniblastus sp.]|nr:molybdopterin converting factor subunit 1 [Mariniblastus sp.]